MLSEASPSIKKATNLLMSMSMDEETRQKYEEREEYLFERKMMLQLAEKAGMEKGIEIGREEGIEIGIEKGKVEGREEAIREMVISMHESGMTMKEIARIARLTNEELQRIING